MNTTTILRGNAAIEAGREALSESPSGEFFRVAKRPADYNAKIVEATRILEGALTGSYTKLGRLQEAMSTSDFPYYLAAVLYKELLPAYQSIAPVWRQFATPTTLVDFRPKKLVELIGGSDILEEVPEGAPYPEGSVDDKEYEIFVLKYGRILRLTFEAFVNDTLGDFRTLPERLAQAARNTEDFLAVSTIASATGPNLDFFKAGNGNAPAALDLSFDNLAGAVTTVTSRVDSDGNPIYFPSLRLVVPPSLDMKADEILNAFEVEVTDGNRKLKVRNTISAKVTKVVNPWLYKVDKSANVAKTWYLLPDPSSARPAVAVGSLRGRETPDLRVKNDQGTAIGGGAIDPTEGSFDNDSTSYRVRHISGAANVDPIGTYVSTGSE